MLGAALLAPELLEPELLDPELLELELLDPELLDDDELAAAITITGAVALLLGSASATAVTMTVAGEGTSTGAAYTPSTEIVPTCSLPPGMPDTCQETLAVALLVTVAANATVPPPAGTDAEAGVT
jgi:hypothetical protein